MRCHLIGQPLHGPAGGRHLGFRTAALQGLVDIRLMQIDESARPAGD